MSIVIVVDTRWLHRFQLAALPACSAIHCALLLLHSCQFLFECTITSHSPTADDLQICGQYQVDKFIGMPDMMAKADQQPPGTIDLNRYKNVLPTPATRVSLPLLEEVDEDDRVNSDYINANYMRGWDGKGPRYVAAQAPKAETVDRFWRLVWHLKTPVIVMVTGARMRRE